MGKKNLGPILLLAIERNDSEKVHEILTNQIRAPEKIRQLCVSAISRPPSEARDVPLFSAAALDDPTMVTYLVETHGVDVNYVWRSGDGGAVGGGRLKVRSALLQAVRKGCHATVSALLSIGADAGIVDHKKRSLLHHAVRRADYGMAKLLLTQGLVRVDVADAADNTPLHVAAIFGHVQLARLLLREDSGIACLNRPAQHGALPIHMAAAQGHVGMLSLFCTEGGSVEISAPCYDGRHKAALHVAAEQGHVEAVVTLVAQHGATVNLHDSEGETPLHCTVLHARDPLGMRSAEDFVRTARALLHAGADVDALNKRGETALHLAARNEVHDALALLLQARADPLIEDNDRNKAVDLVSTRDVLVLQMLRSAMAEREHSVSEALEVRARGFSTATTTPGESLSSLLKVAGPVVNSHDMELINMFAEDGYLQPLGSRSNISQAPLTEPTTQNMMNNGQAPGKDMLLTKSPRKRRSRENLLRIRASKQNGHSSDSSEGDEPRQQRSRAVKPADPKLVQAVNSSQPIDRRRFSSENSSLWSVSPRNSMLNDAAKEERPAAPSAKAASPLIPAKAPGSVTINRKGAPVISIDAADTHRSSEALEHAFSDSDEDTSFVDDESFVTMSDHDSDGSKARNRKLTKPAGTATSGAPLQGWLSQQAGILQELKQQQAAGPIAHSTPPTARLGQRARRNLHDTTTESEGDRSPEPPTLPPRKLPEQPPPTTAPRAADDTKSLPPRNRSANPVLQDITVQLSDGSQPNQTVITVVNQEGKLLLGGQEKPSDHVDSVGTKPRLPSPRQQNSHSGKPPPPTPPKKKPDATTVEKRGRGDALQLQRVSIDSTLALQLEKMDLSTEKMYKTVKDEMASSSVSESVRSEELYAEIESEQHSTTAEQSSDEEDDDEVPNSGHQVAVLYAKRSSDELDNLVFTVYHQRPAARVQQQAEPPTATADGYASQQPQHTGPVATQQHVTAPHSSSSLERPPLRTESADDYSELPHDDDLQEEQQQKRVTYGVEEIIPNNAQRPKDADHRRVEYDGAGRVRITIIGGNAEGVYVHRIDPGSDAERRGLMEGDEVMSIGEETVKGKTREEVMLRLMGFKNQVSMVVRQRRERYERVVDSGGGDAVFVRAHFTHDASAREGELSVYEGDIFSVRDTLPGGQMGSWRVVRLAAASGAAAQEEQEGLIPNQPRAEQIVLTQRLAGQQASRDANSGGFLRRSFRRSKSLDRLNKDSRKGPVAESPLSPSDEKGIAYQRIEQQTVTFHRPVVLLGLFCDAVLDRLLHESPEVFGAPAGDVELSSKRPGAPPVDVRLIETVVASKKHCIMMISPRAISYLETTDLHPIVIYLTPGTKSILKAVRASLAPTFGRRINHLLEEANSFEKQHAKLFTATVSYTADDVWFSLLKDTINRIQNQPLWQTLPDADQTAFAFPESATQGTQARLNRSSDDILGQGDFERGRSAGRDTVRSRSATRGRPSQDSASRLNSSTDDTGKPKSILKNNGLDGNGNETHRMNGNGNTSGSSSSLLKQTSRGAVTAPDRRDEPFQRAVNTAPTQRQAGRQGARPLRHPAASYETPL